jgi:hypothetical protein
MDEDDWSFAPANRPVRRSLKLAFLPVELKQAKRSGRRWSAVQIIQQAREPRARMRRHGNRPVERTIEAKNFGVERYNLAAEPIECGVGIKPGDPAQTQGEQIGAIDICRGKGGKANQSTNGTALTQSEEAHALGQTKGAGSFTTPAGCYQRGGIRQRGVNRPSGIDSGRWARHVQHDQPELANITRTDLCGRAGQSREDCGHFFLGFPPR